MNYSVISTHDWTQEDISPYFNELQELFKKIAMRFPDDITPENLARCILSGHARLWLIFDEDHKLKAFVTTQLEVSLLGVKRVNIKELAGSVEIDGVVKDVLEAIERYSREIEADEVTICGRLGWKRELQKYGYNVSYARYGRKLEKPEEVKIDSHKNNETEV